MYIYIWRFCSRVALNMYMSIGSNEPGIDVTTKEGIVLLVQGVAFFASFLTLSWLVGHGFTQPVFVSAVVIPNAGEVFSEYARSLMKWLRRLR